MALSGGGRSFCRRNFRRQAMAASVPRAAQRLQRAQDQIFLWSISRAPCGSSWRPLRSSRSLMRGEYFARSDARCLHGPALNFLSSFTSLTYRSPFGSHFRPGTLSMFMGRSRPWMGCLAGPHVFVRSRVILVCARVAGRMLLACVGTLADSRAWRMWRWRAPRRRPLWIRVPPC